MLLKERKSSLYQVDSDGFFCTAEAAYPLTLLTICFKIVFEGKVCRIRAALKFCTGTRSGHDFVCRIRAALKIEKHRLLICRWVCRIRAALKVSSETAK